MANPLKYSEMNEIVVKTCLDCGYTKRLPYRIFECPSCEMPSLGFFQTTYHLIGHINRYGLGKINIVDDDVREAVIKAFTEAEE